mgnify:CR=1 FL=1|tara:strand:- start:676 stop:930 length:255 start_codon:yes stop_codon:yes gene_type:complete
MKKQKIVSDFISVSSGILKSMGSIKDYSKSKIKERITFKIEEMNLAKRKDLDELKAMFSKSRSEIELLNKKIIKLEKIIEKNNK